jgi:hypothetical protein
VVPPALTQSATPADDFSSSSAVHQKQPATADEHVTHPVVRQRQWTPQHAPMPSSMGMYAAPQMHPQGGMPIQSAFMQNADSVIQGMNQSVNHFGRISYLMQMNFQGLFQLFDSIFRLFMHYDMLKYEFVHIVQYFTAFRMVTYAFKKVFGLFQFGGRKRTDQMTMAWNVSRKRPSSVPMLLLLAGLAMLVRHLMRRRQRESGEQQSNSSMNESDPKVVQQLLPTVLQGNSMMQGYGMGGMNNGMGYGGMNNGMGYGGMNNGMGYGIMNNGMGSFGAAPMMGGGPGYGRPVFQNQVARQMINPTATAPVVSAEEPAGLSNASTVNTNTGNNPSSLSE